MCLILFGYKAIVGKPLVVAANRDEFHGRETASAEFWADAEHILAGRDLVAGGTWLGCTTTGRFAALTNFSNPDDTPRELSRGRLVCEFLDAQSSARSYVASLQGEAYAGFNLLVFDGNELVYTSNRQQPGGVCPVDVLAPGFYGLSNAELGAEWPKCVGGAQRLKGLTRERFDHQDLIALLNDNSVPEGHQLPARHQPSVTERRFAPGFAPCFIVGDEYGTRASTSVIMANDSVKFCEQSYRAGGKASGRVSYEFDLSQPID